MFTYKEISTLNELELMVYNTIIKNTDKVMYMTIRELADAAGVSTTTVLRFCKKMNCDGYSEFRIRFKLYLERDEKPPVSFGISEIISYFKSINNSEFDELLDKAAAQIASTRRIIFVGIGTSGALGKYSARFFSNIGKFSTYIDDPYYPINSDMYQDAIAIIFSVSGETEEIIRIASQFSLQNCKIISLTNSESSTLARMADLNISYHMPPILLEGHYNITTQIPVLYIIETIGKKLPPLINENIIKHPK
ncbi:MAG: MurR/RpiR family transcriptional regulator [Ewingella americana]|jgi:DNA-binding MurR/RpiR family transcriptional regulator|uniref:Phosphosugar-binding transcriptional regulator n=2 Tax=Ewingella americana TaxID=41202 RepID=A0A085GPI8_EWIA3|nr:MurR/RpiR family transcriptional regulator [Ewingella americana]NWA36601.1 MurR/RpiR family transcriptional regulator [Pseudomonas reactans]KAA8728184.1 MurR/RpiR family transcriptional regulator [Ewingella americana]KFC85633.1 phosphosugar-binding transcriptional regulator [Ewingella americana ATCC 33852]MCI1678034.1 MurR/RpiR family transcriptional regulator [Ewingella americana]MCI1855922.1 MurR/RpiR family transcriptional regulator [Ewingella americana]